MNLEEAVKKAYGSGFKNISGYNIDGLLVNLDLKSETGSIYPGRIIFEENGRYTYSCAKVDDSVREFADEIVKYIA